MFKMIKKLIEKYNNLQGKEVSRQYLGDFTTELFNYLPESEIIEKIYIKISSLLANREENNFKITLSETFNSNAAIGLNAPRHSGLAKEALTECGRLNKGYKYVDGKIVKIETKETKTSKIAALLKKFKADAKKEAKGEIKPKGKEKIYRLGAKYSNDFDYFGLLSYAEKLTTKTALTTLKKLHNSFEDVNLHTIAKPLWDIISLKTTVPSKDFKKKNTHYIEFHNKDKNHKKDKKLFISYEEAVKWGRSELDNFNQDMINFIDLEDDKVELKTKILNLKSKLGLNGYYPEITKGLNGVLFADGVTIISDDELELFGYDDEAEGLNAAAKDVEAIVNELILEKINTGEKLPPWKKTWANKSPVLAQNYETKKPYTGSNSVILNILLGSTMPTPYYVTFEQAKKLGGSVKKGAKAVPLIYYNFVYKLKNLSGNSVSESKLLQKVRGYEIKKGKTSYRITDDNYTSVSLSEKDIKALKLESSEYLSIGFLKYYRVFNIADTEGIEYNIPAPENSTPKEKIAKAEAIVNSFKDKPVIKLDVEKAYYKPAIDELFMPSINSFDNSEEYYSTLFHELIHSTLHESRLDRAAKYKNKDKEAQYAFEELIAELGGSYLCGLAGILEATHVNQASYLKGWHEKLQKYTEKYNDFFVFATKEAQRAVDYIIKDWDSEKELPEEKKGKTYSYHLTVRPFSIGTYPPEDFIEFKDDGSRFGTISYSKKLTNTRMRRYELQPITEILEIEGKTIYHTFGKVTYESKITLIQNSKKVNVVQLVFTKEDGREHKENYSGREFLWKIVMLEYFFDKPTPKTPEKYDPKVKAKAKATALKLKLKLKLK
jgi:antirestriction protein ArdC